MLTAENLECMRRSLAGGDKTTGELARACTWTLVEARSYLAQLAAEGVVVKVRPPAESESRRRRWRSGSLNSLDSAGRERVARRLAPSAASANFATPDLSRELAQPRTEDRAELNPYAPPRHADAAPEPLAEVVAEASHGSFLLGFLAGLFGGCIVVAIVARRCKPKTKEGLYWGFGTGVVFFLFARLLEA